MSEEEILRSLVEEALTIPDGWHEEVYAHPDGTVTFSAPLTQNSWVAYANDPDRRLDEYVGDLPSLSISDFEGIKLRSDGDVELAVYDDVDEDTVEGEYYELARVVTWDDAVDILCDELADDPLFRGFVDEISEKIEATRHQ